eukprot:256365-Rhodomonas_salina.2
MNHDAGLEASEQPRNTFRAPFQYERQKYACGGDFEIAKLVAREEGWWHLLKAMACRWSKESWSSG